MITIRRTDERIPPTVAGGTDYRGRAPLMAAGTRRDFERRPRAVRGRVGRHGSRGASAVEYGLLIAAICALICIGIGVTLKTVLSGTVTCFLEQLQGTAATDASCGSPSGGPGDGGGGGIDPLDSPSPTVTPTPGH